MWGYGSGPHLWATGSPSPLSGRNKCTPALPCAPLFTPHFSPHPPIPAMSPYPPIPPCPTCSPHLAFSQTAFCSCRLCAHILPCAYIPLSPPHTHTQSPIAPPGHSQARYTSPQPTWDLTEPHSPQQHPLSLHWAPTEPPYILPWTSLTPLRSALGSLTPSLSLTGPQSPSQGLHSPPGAPLQPRILPDPIQQEGNAELAKV